MKYNLKNVTLSPVEISDKGFTIHPGQYYGADEFQISSNNLKDQINSGAIVFADSDLNEYSHEVSVNLIRVAQSQDFENFALKSELSDGVNGLTALIDQRVDSLIGGAPGALDTLKEISDALNNNENFQTFVLNELTGKAPIDHNHDSAYHTKSQVSALLSEKAEVTHSHEALYYLKGTIDALLASKSNTNHSHNELYYLRSELNTIISNLSTKNHLHDDRYALKGEGSIGNLGKNFFESENTSVISTTSDFNYGSSQHGDSIEFQITEIGKYRVGWCYNWNCKSTSSNFIGSVILRSNNNNIVTLGYHEEEPSDANGAFASTGTGQQFLNSGWRNVDLNPGVYTLELWVGSSKKNTITSTWNRRFEFWRVA